MKMPLALAFALLATACGKLNDGPKVTADLSRTLKGSIDINDINKQKWTGAVVIEGGKKDSATAPEVPMWRLHVCLEKTDNKAQNRKVVIKVKDLPGKIFSKLGVGPTEKPLGSINRQLDKLTLSLSYTVKSVVDQSVSTSQVSFSGTEVPEYSVESFTGKIDAEKINSQFSELKNFNWPDTDALTSQTEGFTSDKGNSYIKMSTEKVVMTSLTAVYTSCQGREESSWMEKLGNEAAK